MRKSVLLRLALASALLHAAADTAHAQVRPGMGGGQAGPSQVRIFGLAGWARLDVDALNARLAALPEPYTPVDDDMLVLGAGLHVRTKRLLAGVEGAALLSLDAAQAGDTRRAEFSGFYGAFTLGLSVIQTDGLDIYPLVQVGGAGAGLGVRERGEPSWDDVLTNPGRTSTLSTLTLYGAGGLAIEYAFRSGIFLGARGTWGYTPRSDGWSADHGDVLGGPEVDLSGPVVRVLLGFGGRGGT